MIISCGFNTLHCYPIVGLPRPSWHRSKRASHPEAPPPTTMAITNRTMMLLWLWQVWKKHRVLLQMFVVFLIDVANFGIETDDGPKKETDGNGSDVAVGITQNRSYTTTKLQRRKGSVRWISNVRSLVVCDCLFAVASLPWLWLSVNILSASCHLPSFVDSFGPNVYCTDS
jgi:hypothetical protein